MLTELLELAVVLPGHNGAAINPDVMVKKYHAAMEGMRKIVFRAACFAVLQTREYFPMPVHLLEASRTINTPEVRLMRRVERLLALPDS